MTEHVSLLSSDCHEPKHISNAVLTDKGKVITPNGVSTSELRFLTPSEVGISQDFGEMFIIQNATGLALTAAVDSSLYTTTDYTQITSLFSAGDLNNITYSLGELSVNTTGMYRFSGWVAIKYSVNGVIIGLKHTLNGIITNSVSVPTLREKIGNALDIGLLSTSGFVSLSSGDKFGLAIACDTTGIATITDANINLQLIK